MNIPHLYKDVYAKFPNAPDKFEEVVRTVYQSVLKEGAVVFDVGAHTGKHTLDMAAAVGDTGRVYAFEPIAEKFLTLTSKVTKGRLRNICLFNVCCDALNGCRSFTYLPDRPGQSSLHIREALTRSDMAKHIQESLCISLDTFFPDTAPAFIKVDAEGAELDVLRGAQTIISKYHPIVHAELGLDTLSVFGFSSKDIWSYLNVINYTALDILGSMLSHYEDFHASLSTSGVYDYILVHASDTRLRSVTDLLQTQWQQNSA